MKHPNENRHSDESRGAAERRSNHQHGGRCETNVDNGIRGNRNNTTTSNETKAFIDNVCKARERAIDLCFPLTLVLNHTFSIVKTEGQDDNVVATTGVLNGEIVKSISTARSVKRRLLVSLFSLCIC